MPLCPGERSGQPANNATFPIGSIVVQMVAKSLLILIKSGDMFRSTLAYVLHLLPPFENGMSERESIEDHFLVPS